MSPLLINRPHLSPELAFWVIRGRESLLFAFYSIVSSAQWLPASAKKPRDLSAIKTSPERDYQAIGLFQRLQECFSRSTNSFIGILC